MYIIIFKSSVGEMKYVVNMGRLLSEEILINTDG